MKLARRRRAFISSSEACGASGLVGTVLTFLVLFVSRQKEYILRMPIAFVLLNRIPKVPQPRWVKDWTETVPDVHPHRDGADEAKGGIDLSH